MPSKSEEPSVVVRESRVRRDSEHSHHRPKTKKGEDDDHVGRHGEKERTRSFGIERNRRKSETTKPSIWRRATDAGQSIRSRPPLDKKETSRKDSERRSSSTYVYERTRRRESLPLKNEKRSTSETVTRGTKHHKPTIRSALRHDTKFVKPTSTSRPSLHRSQTTTRKERSTHAPSSSTSETRKRALSFSGKSKRPPSILGSVMSSSREQPVKQVECVTCMDDFPATEGNYLKYCKHYWCDSCLKRAFDLSVTDIQHMPPKCCGGKPIQPKIAMHLYKSEFRKLWNAKYAEWTTKDRLYCPAKGCGTWIKPEYIKLDYKGNKTYGKCPKCNRKVCPKCNGKHHPDKKDCPNDPETQAFIKTAKENGWQNCGKCGLTVERIDGCHHMKCPPPCNFEFCILCGAQWKTCQCPWFSNDIIAEERLRAQMHPWPNPHQIPDQLPDFHRNRRVTYQEEIDRRREQERRDEALARRLAFMNMEDDIPIPNHIHGMPADFVQRARNVLAGGHNTANLEEGERLVAQLAQQYAQQPGHPDGRAAPRRYVVRNDYRGQEQDPQWAGQAAAQPPPHAPAPPVRRAFADRGARAGQMAGIMGDGGGDGRVDEWRQWIDG